MPEVRRMTLAVRPKNQVGFGIVDKTPKLQVDMTDERSVENLSRVCNFLMLEGKVCLRSLFNAKHPKDELIEHLASPDIHRTLRRLKIKDMLTDEDWHTLYPKEKSAVSADNYDLRLLLLLVKYTCEIPKPLPNGWLGDPEPRDESQGAALQRLLGIQRELASLRSLKPSAANRLFSRIADQLQRLGHANASACMNAYKQDANMNETDAHYILDEFLTWYKQELSQLDREIESQERKKKRDKEIPILQKKLKTRDLDTSETKKRQSVVGKATMDMSDKSRCQRWAHIKTGMVLEERLILDKYYDHLLNEVKADTVVEHLMSKEIISQDESTEIFATLRNNEQMSTLIDFLVPKSGNVLDEFVESLKPKNEQLYLQMYQDYQAAKTDILANKPQGLPYCNNMLRERYAITYNKWNPIPWYTKVETDIAEFYCQQQLLNLNGKSVNAFEVFEHKESEKDPHTVVIEGDPGTGKSTLAKYMAYKWASDENVFGRPFQLLILLDLKVTAPTVKVMMMEQLFGSECKLAEREIWEVMNINQGTTLLIVDGYEDNLNDEMKSLLFENVMPELHILVFSQTNFTVRLMHRYQRKVILTGFAKSQAEEYVQKYIKLAKKPWDHFASFLNKLAVTKKTTELQKMLDAAKKSQEPQKRRGSSESVTSISSGMPKDERSLERENTDKVSTKLSRSSSKGLGADQQQQEATGETANQSKIASLRHYSQVPLYCSFFCLLTDMRMNIDLNSPTTIVEQFVSCIKLKLIEREKESRFEANRAYAMLSERAMDTMKKGSATFMLAREDSMMTKFGLIQLATNLNVEDNQRYMFGNRLIQEYLAAKYLDTNGIDEASRFFQNMSMTPISYNVVVFYCSIRKSDNDTAATRELFSKILQYNKRRGKASRMKMPAATSPEDNQLVEGKIMDYQLSLECVAVMDMARRDLGKKIVESLPERFTVKHEGIIPRLSLTGLSKMIKFNHTTIQEVDLRLDLLAKETLEAYKSLATAMKTNVHIKTLRIYWTEKDLMADFLQTVCCTEPEDPGSASVGQMEIRRKRSDQSGFHLKNLECIDESGKKLDQLTPKMLNNMREACSNMTKLETFAFQNCQHMALVGSIIKNLPTKSADNLRILDFSGCQMSIVASQDLNGKLVESKSLEGLILANLKIDAMAFNTFIAAFSSNRTIILLDLSGIRLDNVCFFSLSEALKINNKLEKLFLRQVPMDTRACKEVARILKINKTLKLLQVSQEVISEEGRRILGEESQTEARKNRASVDGIDMEYRQRPTNERANTKRNPQSAK